MHDLVCGGMAIISQQTAHFLVYTKAHEARTTKLTNTGLFFGGIHVVSQTWPT